FRAGGSGGGSSLGGFVSSFSSKTKESHHQSGEGFRSTGGFSHSSSSSCSNGQVLNIYGTCVTPEISSNLFVYTAPERKFDLRANPIEAPTPKVNYNIVFVKTPSTPEGLKPVVIPPPHQKTIVYVLTKDSDIGGQQVIEIPDTGVHTPEVFYVNYEEGENPQLPIGIDLRTALSSAVNQRGNTIDDASGGFGGHVSLVRHFNDLSSSGGVAVTGHSGSSDGKFSVGGHSQRGSTGNISVRKQTGVRSSGDSGDQFSTGSLGSVSGGGISLGGLSRSQSGGKLSTSQFGSVSGGKLSTERQSGFGSVSGISVSHVSGGGISGGSHSEGASDEKYSTGGHSEGVSGLKISGGQSQSHFGSTKETSKTYKDNKDN
ncbi:UNVERIFIED_CONTAM: hypothetical protein GTU68_002017, partial [Idotea baltica]|nr:hypothetical protein [Idotea baltica]